MHAKVHPKGGKNEDEIQTRFKSRLNQQQLILNDPPMKIADFCCLWRCQNCFADAQKAYPRQLPAEVAFPVRFFRRRMAMLAVITRHLYSAYSANRQFRQLLPATFMAPIPQR